MVKKTDTGARADPLPVRRAATAYDVAKLAGVSQSAVSRAFTPGASVAPETRKRIITAAKELSYRPNLIARSLIKQRSGTIGVVISYLQNQFNPEVLESLSRALKSAGYNILLFTVDPHSADPVLEEVLQLQVEALVLGSTSLSSAVADECAIAGIPVVLFNRTSAVNSVSSVAGDNVAGSRRIAQFLAAGGHRRFGYIAGLENSSTNQEREEGYTTWLQQNRLSVSSRAVGNYTFQGAWDAMREICSQPKRPDAVFCANDHMAIAALEVARSEFGLDVPGDLSIVGFDDVGAARWPSFSLTSFSQPVDVMVAETVRILLGLIGGETATREAITVPGHLIVRRSARLPPHGIERNGDVLVWCPNDR
ncbi:LacI family DNA-binding transcriptional regulator [Methylobacterium sp. SyP6R]|uniref:LacI family DNA-binding transcriptional regulator n=1 Tax=Methylobacterium sp. SyP6R TaxID=2718876 RepID=UPI001F20AEA4|nr:LacI family DNA-binding transcriptional regulator [Methylobacterium sp. SyP6R]MCF4127681.1 LacI family DNA-binding transcriptional regulator [Methylobacterium sp. SyP6R]